MLNIRERNENKTFGADIPCDHGRFSAYHPLTAKPSDEPCQYRARGVLSLIVREQRVRLGARVDDDRRTHAQGTNGWFVAGICSLVRSPCFEK